MQPKSDAPLLREYAEHGAEAAFAEIVTRHANLVYSAVLRQVPSPDVAAEVAQSVFIGLARGARLLTPRLAEDASLAGWLCRSARNISLNLRRDEYRRHSRERLAMEHLDPTSETAPDWERLRPVLDEAMSELDEPDYDALVMRFFKNQDLRSVGVALGVSDDTAQKRVSRALEKLREHLSKRGVTTPAAALSIVLSANAVHAAPVGLAVTISTAAALAGTTIATTATTTATKAIAMTALQKTLITTAVVAGVATTLVIQHQSQLSLRQQNESLRQQIAHLQTDNEILSGRIAPARRAPIPRLPTPPMQVAVSRSEPTEDLASTNLYSRLKENSAKLTTGQVEPYLNANRRSASSLLAAYRTTGDPALLEEAMLRYPDDPQVAFEAAFKKDTSPEQRRQWIEAFKKAATDNALPNYLSALDYFKAGQADQAVQELIAASGKQQFQDFTLARMQDDEEAYLAAGYPMAEAKTIPAWQLLLPQLAQIKDLSQHMVDLASS